MATDLGGLRIAYCPMPGCPWASVTIPGDAEHDGALAEIFGVGVFAATARAQRLQDHEREIREHLDSHPVQDWALALAAAQDRIRELEGTERKPPPVDTP